MSDVYSLFEQEAADPQAFNKVREGDTKDLSSLIRRSVDLDQQIKDTEALLKDLQQKKRSVDEEDIPSIMQTMGVESLQVDGNKVTVDKFVSARIPETKKQEAFQYLRDVEGVNDSPPRVIDQLFEDAGLEPPGNLSLYLNRLRERGFLVTPPSAKEKNRYAILTPEGRAHLDKRSRY